MTADGYPTTQEEVIESDQAFVNGLPLRELRKLWKENQRNIHHWFMTPNFARAYIDRKWSVLAPEFAKHGIGFDSRGNEVPMGDHWCVNKQMAVAA